MGNFFRYQQSKSEVIGIEHYKTIRQFSRTRTKIYDAIIFSKIFFICLLLPQGVSVYISTASLTTIALERLKAVRETNVMRQTDKRNAVFKIVLINVMSVLAILPYSLHMEVKIN